MPPPSQALATPLFEEPAEKENELAGTQLRRHIHTPDECDTIIAHFGPESKTRLRRVMYGCIMSQEAVGTGKRFHYGIPITIKQDLLSADHSARRARFRAGR